MPLNGLVPFRTRVMIAAEILGVDPAELREALDRDPPDRILDYAAASELLGMSVGALRLRVYRGTIPHIRQGARTVRFSERALLGTVGQ